MPPTIRPASAQQALAYDRSHRHHWAPPHPQTYSRHEQQSIDGDERLARLLESDEFAWVIRESLETARREEAQRERMRVARYSSPGIHQCAPRSTPTVPALANADSPRAGPSSLESAHPRPQVSPKPRNTADELRQHHDLFTGDRTCSRCDFKIQAYPTPGEGNAQTLLHTICPACSATQCRGCSTPTPPCDSRCCGGERCPLSICCDKVRAIAIFEIVCEFDKQYSARCAEFSGTGIWPVPRRDRKDFMHLVTSGADREVTALFNELLLNTLTAITRWLLPDTLARPVHCSVLPLIASSFLMEVVHRFLEHNNYHNWIINGNIYTQILKLFKLLGNRRCLSDLLLGRLPVINVSSGIQVWMWYPDSIWEARGRSYAPVYSVAFSNNAQQAIARLETIIKRQDLQNLAATIREDFQRLTLLVAGGPDLP